MSPTFYSAGFYGRHAGDGTNADADIKPAVRKCAVMTVDRVFLCVSASFRLCEAVGSRTPHPRPLPVEGRGRRPPDSQCGLTRNSFAPWVLVVKSTSKKSSGSGLLP